MEIKKMAKEGNNEGCKMLAKQLVQMRKQKTRLYTANSKISSVQIQNKAMGANIAIAGAMGATAKTMGSMNKIMNPQQIAKDMEAFKQANLKMDMTDDMISDTLDDIMTESGDEEESEGIVNQVLDEIGIEVSGKMANAPSVARNKVGESTSDIDKELMAQLTKLKS
uniref:Charged multivesicular body protein 2B n=2 Tax=Pararge aegeria TaxID=116150 RepID=S4P6P8_9NEOP